jgi:soluble lytic murein transglycosylase-like protein
MDFKRLMPWAFLGVMLVSSPLQADVYRFQDSSGVWHFSNTRSDPRYHLYIKSKGLSGKQYLKKYDSIIQKAAELFGVEVTLIKAIIKAESYFNPNAVSKSGAQGLMQLMPDTADDMKVRDPFDPEENILGGTRYLSLLLKRFNHDKRLAVAAYNVGPTTVAKHDAVPPIPQTKQFVEKVMRFYREYKEKSN